VTGSKDGNAVTVTLTGIATAADGQIIGVHSFNTVFGPGSLIEASAEVVGLPTEVSVSAANTAAYDAATTGIAFKVHPTSTFTYNIENFAAGDRLVFDYGTAIGLTNSSGADGVITVTGSKDGNAVTINLTYIAAASDGQITGVNSFNTVFGAGSLVAESVPDGEEPPAGEGVSVSTAGTYDAATGAVVFLVHPTSSFTYSIAHFAAGDRLVFDVGTAVGVTNSGDNSGTDGVITVTGTKNSNAATINLTGVAVDSDKAIFGVNSFNAVFGSGSLSP
jgi:hypothetical protein